MDRRPVPAMRNSWPSMAISNRELLCRDYDAVARGAVGPCSPGPAVAGANNQPASIGVEKEYSSLMFNSSLNTRCASCVRMSLEADLEKAILREKANLEGANRRCQPGTRRRVSVVFLGPFRRVRTGQRLANSQP